MLNEEERGTEEAVDAENQTDITEELIKGYIEMSEINLALAEDALITDNQLWSDILD